MKKQIITFLFTLTLSFFVVNGFSQGPPPPPGTGHGQNGNQAAGNAPIGSGLIILLGLGAIYGGKKTYSMISSDKNNQ